MYMIPYTRRSNSSMMDLFDELERSMFGESGRRTPVFSTDIRDEGAHYLLQADLPGFRKEDIHVDLKGETLTIRAERHSDYEKDDKKKSYLHVERSYGSYERSFDVSGIKLDAITVSYTDGVLSITLPKEEVKQPESRSLEVK